MNSKFYLILHDQPIIDDIKEDVVDGTTLPVYSCFRKASNVLKKINNSRFKVFDSQEKAESYAKYYHKLTFYSDECIDNFDSNSKVVLPQFYDNNKDSPLRGEKPSLFKNPTALQLLQFRNFINSNDVENVYSLCLGNPRLLISNGDTPVILQEGARYHALHICARKIGDKLFNVCAALLDLLDSDSFFQKLFPEDTSSILTRRKFFLNDLYLNNPDKILFETPLHMACKFGNVAIVRLLVSHPLIDKSCKNKDGKTCCEIICDRYDCDDRMEILAKIQQNLEDQYYVPVVRDLVPHSPAVRSVGHNRTSSVPIIGRPFMWNSLSPEAKQKSYQPKNLDSPTIKIDASKPRHESSTLSPKKDRESSPFCPKSPSALPKYAELHRTVYPNHPNPRSNHLDKGAHVGKIDALAGPMPYTKAQEFYRAWNVARRDGSRRCIDKGEEICGDRPPIDNNVALGKLKNDIAKKDAEKGLEIIGRRLAKSMNVPWAERWDFLNREYNYKSTLKDKEIYCFEDSTIYMPMAEDANEMSLYNLSKRLEESDCHGNDIPVLPDYLHFVDVSTPKGLSKLEAHLSKLNEKLENARPKRTLFKPIFESSIGSEERNSSQSFIEGFTPLTFSDTSFDSNSSTSVRSGLDYGDQMSSKEHDSINEHFENWREPNPLVSLPDDQVNERVSYTGRGKVDTNNSPNIFVNNYAPISPDQINLPMNNACDIVFKNSSPLPNGLPHMPSDNRADSESSYPSNKQVISPHSSPSNDFANTSLENSLCFNFEKLSLFPSNASNYCNLAVEYENARIPKCERVLAGKLSPTKLICHNLSHSNTLNNITQSFDKMEKKLLDEFCLDYKLIMKNSDHVETTSAIQIHKPSILSRLISNIPTFSNMIGLVIPIFSLQRIPFISPVKSNINKPVSKLGIENYELEEDSDAFYTPPSTPPPLSLPKRPSNFREVPKPTNGAREIMIQNGKFGNFLPFSDHHPLPCKIQLASTPYNYSKLNEYKIPDFPKSLPPSPMMNSFGVTKMDFDIYAALAQTDINPDKYPHVALWFKTIETLPKFNKVPRPRQWIMAQVKNNHQDISRLD